MSDSRFGHLGSSLDAVAGRRLPTAAVCTLGSGMTAQGVYSLLIGACLAALIVRLRAQR